MNKLLMYNAYDISLDLALSLVQKIVKYNVQYMLCYYTVIIVFIALQAILHVQVNYLFKAKYYIAQEHLKIEVGLSWSWPVTAPLFIFIINSLVCCSALTL